jgi:hypothetical protein
MLIQASSDAPVGLDVGDRSAGQPRRLSRMRRKDVERRCPARAAARLELIVMAFKRVQTIAIENQRQSASARQLPDEGCRLGVA